MLIQATDQLARIETTCGLLLSELQDIWNEVGEPETERDSMLLAIEQECLAVYRRKVDEAKRCKADMLKAIAVCSAEIADIISSMGGPEVHSNKKIGGNLKEELHTVNSQLEELQKKTLERKNQFAQVLDQLQKISFQLGRPADCLQKHVADETNLSMERLEDLHRQLVDLQNEKRNRLREVESHMKALNSLCLVLGKDFNGVISEIHPSLVDSKLKDASTKTLDKLAATVQSLYKVKTQKTQKLQDLTISLIELWNLLNTPLEEQKKFQNVTCNIAASEPEITEPNILSNSSIKLVEDEVMRLSNLKSTKIKELILRRRLELEEICRKMHMATEVLKATEYSIESIEAGVKDPEYLLEQIDCQISTVKEEASSRKEILEKVEKWMAACEAEAWLEEYNRDDNRYNAGRGAHLILKRAEKARILVNKIPGMVEALTLKVTAWEREKGNEFFYDDVRLLSMLQQYMTLRQEKELEKQRQRGQKKLKVQLLAEQEALYGSKPSPTKSVKKTCTASADVLNNRKLSFGVAMLQNLKTQKEIPRALPNGKSNYWDQCNISRHQRSSGLPTPSGRRMSEMPDRSNKKPLSIVGKASKTKSPFVRKPLSPVPVNVEKSLEDHKETHTESSKRITPTKLASAGLEEKRRTPTKAIPFSVPTTPAVSVAMVMATTPAASFVVSGAKTDEKRMEHVEYSFEEVRAGFSTCH